MFVVEDVDRPCQVVDVDRMIVTSRCVAFGNSWLYFIEGEATF
jgi:hypothetical protein